jgi:pimeloyl-ACP methyl ester carboxylesterase
VPCCCQVSLWCEHTVEVICIYRVFVGKLPPPRSMNTLLGEFCGPVLVAQGALDPLNDAVGRAYALRSIRPGIQVALMRLGHCPMDEGAAEVGREVTAWARANGI